MTWVPGRSASSSTGRRRFPSRSSFRSSSTSRNSPTKVYFGGPVELESLWFLFRAAGQPEHAVKACDGVYLSGDRRLLLKLLGRDKPMEGLRIFAGHAGWAPGQLENEIERHDWTAKRAEAEAIFGARPEHPWPPPDKGSKLGT